MPGATEPAHPIDRAILDRLIELSAPIFATGFAGERAATLKSADQPVTSTDLAVTDALYAALAAEGFSAAEILSEERPSAGLDPASARLWIIDPLDGTKEFIAGIGEFALSIAYRAGGQLAAAAIFNPVTRLAVVGTRADAIRFDPELARAAAATHGFSPAAVLCSRSEWQRGQVTSLAARAECVAVGSIAYKLALVAAGAAAATVSYEPKSSWDIAAGALLVELAGGRVTDLRGQPLDFSDPRARHEHGVLACRARGEHAAWLAKLAP